MNFLSHIEPDRRLQDHLREVHKNMEEALQGSPPVSLLQNQKIAEIFLCTGLGHDFGKYTTFFQKKLKGDFDGREANHGFISALFVFYLVKYKLKFEYEKPYALLAYMAVLHHHGNLRNVLYDTGLNSFNDKRENKNLQLKDLQENKEIIEKEYRKLGFKISLEEFSKKQDEIENELQRQGFLYGNFADKVKKSLYLNFVYLYSCLIDADKRHAARVEGPKRRDFSPDLVDKYKEVEFAEAEDNQINQMREEIYQKVMGQIEDISLNEKIMSFTSPTGSGKTLTSFSAALKLRNKIKKKQGYLPRIIYSLPFTSIIDQNHEVLYEVISYADDFKSAPEEFIIKHHHLADIEYSRRGEKLPLDEALMLIESWESEIVVTTFIQLFHTLLGYKNSFLKKYHNISGSIIILDEVQNIPVKYWDLVNYIFRLLAEELNCYIILLTATRPLIFRENISELLQEGDKYFAKMSRTELKPRLKERDIDDFVGSFQENYEENKSYLLVLNTIKSSIEVYQCLKDVLDMEENILYLSTNIYPAQRKERLDKITEKLKKEEQIIVVSTQVIEAGVDIDMDVIYRDLGPVDSLIQVAGRGNREAGSERAPIYIYNLKKDEEKSRSFCSMVYGSVHRNISRKILQDRDIIPEKEYKYLVEDFFEEIVEAQSGIEESKKLVEACLDLKFSNEQPSLADFQLIDNNPNYIDMFVVTDDSREIWNEFLEKVVREKEYTERKKNFLDIKQDFYSYIISVPVRIAKKYINPEASYKGVFAANCSLNHYYDQETGFKHEEDSWDIDNRLL